MRTLPLAILLLIFTGCRHSSTLYVDPSGNDANPGSASCPLHTLEAARDRARLLPRPASVVISGLHFRNTTLALDSRDSSTVFRGMPGSRIVLGHPLPALSSITDPAILRRLPESARSHVLQINLKSLGISDFGQFTSRGFGRPGIGCMELFANDHPLTLARWPNQGSWEHIGSQPDTRDSFAFISDHIKHWSKRDDIWMHGYWTWNWADSYDHIASIDFDKGIIRTAEPHGVYGYRAGQRFYFLNILEELDSPGEYYLDRNTGVLFVWPPDRTSAGGLWVSSGIGPILSITGAHDLSVENLILEGSWTGAVAIADSSAVTLSGCTIRDTGTDGVVITAGLNCGLLHCQIYNAGECAVRLSGGDRKSLTPASHFVQDCDLHDYARICRTYHPAVDISGVGCRVSHCDIHDAPHEAVTLHGNDHLIQYNHIHRVCQETSDCGAIYTGRDWTERGAVIRDNFFDNIHGLGKGDAMAVYFDDGSGGAAITDNLFYQVECAIELGGSTDMLVDNNIFVDCGCLHLDGRADMLDDQGWKENYQTLVQRLRSVDYKHPPYSTRYPELLDIARLVDAGRGVPPARNRFTHNIQSGGTWITQQYGIKDPSILHFENNYLAAPASIFLDPGRLDFHLRPDAGSIPHGFHPIPLESIGPRQPFR